MITEGIIAIVIITIARICQGLVLTHTGKDNVNNSVNDV